MNTHKTRTIQYSALAKLLSDARDALPSHSKKSLSRIPSQSELAKALGITQQTFSRWLSGQSRPRQKQLGDVAKLLNINFEKLQETAGYAVQKANVTLDEPFPLGALSPESFERFCGSLVEAMYPGANIYRAGGQGHKQDGIDLTIRHQDGTKHVYQCKRYETFGPQKVHEVVAKEKTDAEKKILMLTRVASPQTRNAMAQHENWELWDRDDISRKVRQLPFDDQKRLVRVYFPGKAIDLLGRSAMSAWETPAEFFRPFSKNERLFSHTWALIGRDKIVDDIKTAIDDDKIELILVSGLAGGGKTRVLKEVLEKVEQEKPRKKILVASPTAELDRDAFEELEVNQMILVVDDAHDRNDLPILFSFAVTSGKKVKLVLLSRKYGIDRIKARASGYSLVEKGRFEQVDIEPLSLDDAEALAKEVLTENKGKLDTARDIAKLTCDCPLATVLAAQIVAQDKLSPAFVQIEESFRQTLLARFENVIAGHLGIKENADQIKALLGFLALVQPFEIGNNSLLEAFKKVENVDTPEINRLLNLLLNAGVIFKRGSKYRLSPDILGDHLLESRFEGPGGQSNGLAERYFDLLDGSFLQTMITNLGRIDWRRTGKTDEESPLLDGVWSKLEPTYEYSDPHIKAVESVAFYQPRRALEFVEKYIREDKFTNQLANIAKYAAYTEKYQRQALECMWELGRKDDHYTNSEPSHPIRILTEMAEPTPGKPLWVLEGVLVFGIELIRNFPSVWDDVNTPCDFLEGIFKTTGFTTSSTRIQISMHPYPVDPDMMKKYRQQLVDVLIETLKHEKTKAAVKAAVCIGEALRYPTDILGMSIAKDLYAKWDADFLVTLEKIECVMQEGALKPLVQVQLNRELNWHAVYNEGVVAERANLVQDLVSQDLDVRAFNMLVDGWGMDQPYDNYEEREKQQKERSDTLIADLLAAYPNPEVLRQKLEGYLTDLEQSGLGETGSQSVFVNNLIDTVDGFAECIANSALNEPEGRTANFADFAIGRLLVDKRENGRDFVKKFLEHGHNNLKACIATGYNLQDYSGRWLNAFDIDVLIRLLSSTDEGLVRRSINVLRRLVDFDPVLTKSLIKKTNFISEQIADEVTSVFEFKSNLNVSYLSNKEVELLLSKLQDLPTLRGHWLERFFGSLSVSFPWQCTEFFQKRVDAACAGSNVEPVNRFHVSSSRLRFSESADALDLMERMFKWIRKNIDRKDLFGWYSKNLFEAMFGPFDAKVVSYLSRVLSGADETDVKLIATLLSEANAKFIFENAEFIETLLERAQQYGSDTHRYVTSELCGAALSGMRSGTSGQPFPQDIELRDNADAALKQISRFSPSFKFYDAILKHAKGEIEAHTFEDEEFDD